jgi:hypothetical protein
MDVNNETVVIFIGIGHQGDMESNRLLSYQQWRDTENHNG